METMKVLIVGDGNVGKTSLLIKYITDTFPSEHIPTVLDNYSLTINCKNKPYRMEIWDTAGQEEFANLRKFSYSHTDVAFVCFGINDRTSYSNVENLWSKEVQYYSPKTIVILVGTKQDLRDDQETIERLEKEGKSLITFKEGKLLAEKIKAYTYVECSALQSIFVRKLFSIGALSYLEKKSKPVQNRTCSIL